MAISIVRVHDERPYVYTELGNGHEIVVFDPVDERGEDSLGDRFRALDPSIRECDLLVVRGSTQSTRRETVEDPIIAHLGPERVLTLTRSYDASNPHPVLAPVRGEVDFDLDPVDLRSAEVDSMIHRSGCVFAHQDHHFVLPSGWHADQFIRLASATRSIVDCRRLADWVLAEMTPEMDLLADTGALLPVIQEVQRHAQGVFGWRTRVDVLDEYPTVADILERLRDLRGRNSSSRRGTLFVVSVSSSGAAVNRFHQATGEVSVGKSLVICDAADEDGMQDAMARLPATRWRPGADGLCRECGSPAKIIIDPSSYDPRTRFELSPKAISPRLARGNANLFQVLSDHDAVRLHYTSNRGAHYAVWIDTPALLSVPAVQEEFHNSLEAVVRQASLTLVPEGPAAGQILELVRQAGGTDVRRIAAHGDSDEGVRAAIAAARKILIVDDVIVSGLTLMRLRRAVYRVAQPSGHSPDVAAMVYLARPSRLGVLDEVSRPYRGDRGENMHRVHEILLPSGKECSWCGERNVLRGLRSQLSENSKEVADRRIERLSGELVSPVLLGGEESTSSLRTENSFFGSLTERPAIAAAAAAVKKALEEMRRASTGDRVEIIDIGKAIDAYFDPVLLIGVLRTCTKRQVRFAAQDPKISARYGNLSGMGDDLPQAARCELAWAVVMELLPREGFDPIMAGVSCPEGDLLREVLQLGGRRSAVP